MARTVVAIYDDFQSANSAVRDLVDHGFPRDNISLIANNSRGEFGYPGTSTSPAISSGSETVTSETSAGAGIGAGIGAAAGGIGGLLVGLGALVIPGIGPIIAAGPLAVALTTLTGAGVGAVAGGVTGGMLGALIGLGIPEEEAGYYAEGVRRGGVLVTVQAEDKNTDQVVDLLNQHNPMDVKSRVEQWRKEGWTGFDPNKKSADWDIQSDDRSEMTTKMSNKAEYRTEFDPDYEVYHTHYKTHLINEGYPYEYYVPAYRYGYGLATNPNYEDLTWDAIEADARTNWEGEHPGTWDSFKSAVRNAWDDLTSR